MAVIFDTPDFLEEFFEVCNDVAPTDGKHLIQDVRLIGHPLIDDGQIDSLHAEFLQHACADAFDCGYAFPRRPRFLATALENREGFNRTPQMIILANLRTTAISRNDCKGADCGFHNSWLHLLHAPRNVLIYNISRTYMDVVDPDYNPDYETARIILNKQIRLSRRFRKCGKPGDFTADDGYITGQYKIQGYERRPHLQESGNAPHP